MSDMTRDNCDFYYCSTCGGQSSRVEDQIKNIGNENLVTFLNSLSFSDFNRHGAYDNWRMYIRHLLVGPEWVGWDMQRRLSDSEIKIILNNWESKIEWEDETRFLDFIMFYFFRHVKNDLSIKTYWLKRCLERLEEEEDESLIETIIYAFKSDSSEEFVDLAKSRAEFSYKIQQALFNSGLEK